MKKKSDDLLDKINQLQLDLKKLRPLSVTNPSGEMPVSLGHQPIDPMLFEVGEISKTPWRGVTCFGIRMTEEEVIVMCDVARPIHLDPHHHGDWSESLVMAEGSLYDHIGGERYDVGSHYYQPANRLHEPEFLTPARCLITWRRQKSS